MQNSPGLAWTAQKEEQRDWGSVEIILGTCIGQKPIYNVSGREKSGGDAAGGLLGPLLGALPVPGCSWLFLAVPAFVFLWRKVGRNATVHYHWLHNWDWLHKRGRHLCTAGRCFLMCSVVVLCFVLPRGGVLCAEACSQPN